LDKSILNNPAFIAMMAIVALFAMSPVIDACGDYTPANNDTVQVQSVSSENGMLNLTANVLMNDTTFQGWKIKDVQTNDTSPLNVSNEGTFRDCDGVEHFDRNSTAVLKAKLNGMTDVNVIDGNGRSMGEAYTCGDQWTFNRA
jgi:hypothetical protein